MNPGKRCLKWMLLMAACVTFGTFALRAEDSSMETGVEQGQIQGARFAIAVPPGSWNHRVLILVHGFRPEGAPLVPDLHPERLSLKTLLGEGWIVATTSFRRNGLVVDDAIEDVDALRAYIANAYGEPDRVILSGESLGGMIVTLMAERDKSLYDGAIAYDPTLHLKQQSSKFGLSLLPRIPLLFVATRLEVAPARSYLTALTSRPEPTVQPALFLIDRDGHTNVNQAEHLAAIRAMNDWLDSGAGALPRPVGNSPYYDATVPPAPAPSTAQMHPDGRGFDIRISGVDAIYGNILIEAQAADFAAAGIAPMTFFEMTLGGHPFRVLYGRSYTDVKTGEWIAFPDADGRTLVSRYLADGAATSGAKVGDTAAISRYPDSPAPKN